MEKFKVTYLQGNLLKISKLHKDVTFINKGDNSINDYFTKTIHNFGGVRKL